MNYLAQFDALTGIPNRHSFSELLTRATARARREGRKVTLLYLDLDEFKFVNDTLGHDAGDSLLKEVAGRLRSSVRAGDVVARLGGDEFAVMIEGLSGPLEVETVAEGLIKVLAEPYHIAGRQLAVTASLGITMFPSDNSDPQMLLKNADIAMYQAKEGGRNTFRFFTQRMHEELMQYHELARDLRDGLARNEFRLAFQPKVNLLTKRLQGLEALLRWTSPTRGEVGPATFIPVAEQSGHIVPLGYWVIDQVCRQINTWRAAGYPVVPVSLNVSARQFQLPDFHQRVAEVIGRHGVDPSLIEIEITEGLMMEDTGLAERCLDYLKSVGVRISVDDFGTGYSCLSYLHRFPIDVLKIDRSFIRQIGQGSGNEKITDAIISLARSLQLETVAEGVETTEQVDFLVTHGCHVAQGFLFGKPMDAEAVEPMLDELRAWMTETTAIRRALAVGAA
jgi:diguanylate cyclase (GGDEF)-like protein